MTKEIPQHKDKLGRFLQIGDAVCFADSNRLAFGIIQKLNPKMIKVCRPNSKWSQNKYPDDMVKVDGPDVSMYLLMNSGKK